MKKFLLDDKLYFYKANLHCHTNISDAILSPEEIKELYKKNGYSIIAYTDHDVLLPHDDLNDENFLSLHGFEFEIMEEPKGRDLRQLRAIHLCMIALDPNNLTQPCFHRTKYFLGNAEKYKHLVKFDESKKDFEREYSTELINKVISEMRSKGFFVTYNHPSWSLESYEEYSKYVGFNAVEMFNGYGNAAGYEDYNPRVYNDLLNLGNKIYCTGSDDNHNFNPVGSRLSDSFLAFTVINSPALKYTDVTDSLVNGKFYCSEGPIINSLSYEDEGDNIKFFLTFSSCDNVFFVSDNRFRGVAFKEKSGPLTKAEFSVSKLCKWVRFTLVDESGKKACTNAYFIEDLLK